MSELTPKQQKLLDKAKKFGTSKELATAESFIELEEKVDYIAESIDTRLNSLSEELKKKLESELVLEIDKEELKGDVGEQGEKGEKGDRGEKGEKGDKGDTTVIEKVIERTETIRELPLITKEVIEVAKTDKKTLKKIGEIEKTTKDLMEYEIPTLQNRTQLLNQLVSGVRKDLDNIPPVDLSGYVPYTGATTNVDLGAYNLKNGTHTQTSSPTFTYSSGKLSNITYANGVEKDFTYNLDGTLDEMVITYPDASTITKTLSWSGGVLQSINIV